MVEMGSRDPEGSAAFMEKVFGFPATAYGSGYQDVHVRDGVTVGFQGNPAEAPAQPMPIFQVEGLEKTRAAVIAAGGEITLELYVFPGGRRFHFREPGSSELAAWVPQ